MPSKVNLDEKFAVFDERWRPKVIAALNNQEIKIIKAEGEFPWHSHQDADEFFLVWRGTFRVEFRDQAFHLNPGDCIVVPRGVEHRTAASTEAQVVCFEPTGVINTGDVLDPVFTAPGGVAI